MFAAAAPVVAVDDDDVAVAIDGDECCGFEGVVASVGFFAVSVAALADTIRRHAPTFRWAKRFA